MASRTSIASRSPSPRKLNAITVIMMASPGTVVRWGATNRKCLPSLIIAPQEGMGGATPRPRKPNPAPAPDPRGDPEGGLDDDGRDRVREDVDPEEPRGRGADRPCRLDELHLPDFENLPPDEPGVPHPAARGAGDA